MMGQEQSIAAAICFSPAPTVKPANDTPFLVSDSVPSACRVRLRRGVEMFWQLALQARSPQVENARIGLTDVIGGGISGLDHGACAIRIFERA